MFEEEIQGDLIKFSTLDTRDREERIGSLGDTIRTVRRKGYPLLDWMSYTQGNPEQTFLETAINKALNTPFVISRTRQEFLPYQGGITAVALRSDGLIVAAVNREIGDVYVGEMNKQDFSTFKALESLHLELSGIPGGIYEHQEYLDRIMGGHAYLGDARTRRTSASLTPLAIGLSGCGLNPDYRRGIVKDVQPVQSNYENVGAGLADSLLGALIVYYYDNPRAPIEARLESEDLRKVRIGN